MRETVSLNREENRRAMILAGATQRGRTNREIAEVLGISIRQVQRLRKRIEEAGPTGLAHGNRGTKPGHALSDKLASEIVRLYKQKYKGFNFSHFHEKLTDIEKIAVSLSSVRRILTCAGCASPRKRRAPKHRSRRERMACEGAMLQLDGSAHDWLEGRGPKMCLLGAIDDATGKVPAVVFREHEDAQGYFLLMRRVISRYGIPESVYHDHHSIFERDSKREESLEEQLEGKRALTQFGRLMEELGVRQIAANSPQAKGRVERLWNTFQDRLVSELRLANACTPQEAEEVLERVRLEHNRRFARKPADPKSVWRKLGNICEWDSIFCFKYRRTVAKDNTLSLFNTLLQITPGPASRSYAGCKVEVQQRFDGSLRVYYKAECIARTEPSISEQTSIRVRAVNGHYAEERPFIPTKQATLQEEVSDKAIELRTRTPYKPAPNHPWRKPAMTKS